MEAHDVSNPNAVCVAQLALVSSEIFPAVQGSSGKRRVWQRAPKVGKLELVEPGCAGADGQDRPLT